MITDELRESAIEVTEFRGLSKASSRMIRAAELLEKNGYTEPNTEDVAIVQEEV